MGNIQEPRGLHLFLQGIERVKICFDVGAISRQVVMAGDL